MAGSLPPLTRLGATEIAVYGVAVCSDATDAATAFNRPAGGGRLCLGLLGFDEPVMSLALGYHLD